MTCPFVPLDIEKNGELILRFFYYFFTIIFIAFLRPAASGTRTLLVSACCK